LLVVFEDRRVRNPDCSFGLAEQESKSRLKNLSDFAGKKSAEQKKSKMSEKNLMV